MKNVIRKLLLVVLASLSVVLVVRAQPICTVTHYDEDDGLSQWRISQMLQDNDGLLWFSTWNGLNRFDGYEFVQFKSRPGDKEILPADRLRDMRMDAKGNIYVMADKEWFLFHRQDCSFSKADVSQVATFNKGISGRQAYGCINRPIDYRDRNGVAWHIDVDGRLSYKDDDSVSVNIPLEWSLKSQFYMSDRQGNLWLFGDNGIFRLNFVLRPSQRLATAPAAQGSCAFLDRDGNCWLTTRTQSSVVQVYDSHNRLLGYLNRTGRLQPTEVEFGLPIYCIYQTRDGTLWMGSKPGGLFRLLPDGQGAWKVEQFLNTARTDVYDIAEDSKGRVWVATMGSGMFVCENANARQLRFVNLQTFPGYPRTRESKIRRLHITASDVLLAATTEGLLVGRIPSDNLREMAFRMHQRESNRTNSLSCNATTDILETPDHRVFISTESGGVCEIEQGTDLLAEKIDFRHYDKRSGLNSDVAMSMACLGSVLWIVGSNQLMRINIDDASFDFLDSHFFHESYRFSECRPVRLDDGRWIVGVSDGFVTMSDMAARKSQYVPPIVLTGIDTQGKGINYSVNHLDKIVLSPDERSFILYFAAIDTDDPKGINYAFKMEDEGEWNYIGHNRSASFAGLEPGTYHLQIRSTNADGVWVNNIRTVKIVVEPRFFEAWYGKLLLLFVILGLIAVVAYTVSYIRRIKREQHDTLQAYLELLEKDMGMGRDDGVYMTEDSQTEPALPKLSAEDGAFMSRIMQFVESHIGDADASINDMAEAAAVSRSGLNRKMKSLVGLTPADFLREARIKRACQLLKDSDRSVSDIAYSCGFTDPKYFAKCFRSSEGKSPSEYRGLSLAE